MIHLIFSDYLSKQQSLSRRMADFMWNCSIRQFNMGVNLMESFFGRSREQDVPAAIKQKAAAVPSAEQENLEVVAMNRMKSGHAPPPEVYDIRNRGKIDWSKAPDWARPADPEAFEGCAHEG
jgi:hypothetical protein